MIIILADGDDDGEDEDFSNQRLDKNSKSLGKKWEYIAPPLSLF